MGVVRRRQPPVPARWGRACLAGLALLLGFGTGGQATELPTLTVLGVENRLPPKERKKGWDELRLGMGIRGRVVQMAADGGDFVVLDDRSLAPSVREALGGYWLREPQAEALRDLEGVQRSSAVDWIVFGSLDEVGVRRDRAGGLVSGVQWRYRVALTLCIHGAGGRKLCRQGEGTSVQRAISPPGISYQGDDPVWDQAGPAEALDQALGEAFGALIADWRKSFAGERRAALPGPPPPPAGQPLRVYVASFGLSQTVASAYPELAASQVGWGICNRIVEGLWDSGRFTFLEAKAEIVEHMARLMRGQSVAGEDAAPPEAAWLLYGEVIDLQVARREKVLGGSTTMETRVVIQVRLRDRAGGRILPATGTGIHQAPLRDWRARGKIEDLDPTSIGLATDDAARQATAKLLQGLG